MFSSAKTIVIKIGSSTIVDEHFELRSKWLKSLVKDVAELKKQKKKIIIVSSGAVALGRKSLDKMSGKLKIEEKQAAAAIGQPLLIANYSKDFGKHKLTCSQVLLTISDTENRRSYLNARNTFETLLEKNITPIVNENDTVATEELRFGDNDRLSALVAQMVSADLLIIFSDVDGLYTDNPRKNKSAKHIPLVEKIDKNIESLAGDTDSKTGSGGMITKIKAAQIAAESGCSTIIASSIENHSIKKLFSGGKHTFFKASENPSKARKKWILNSLVNKGKIIVDDGAEKALLSHKSLLAVGIKSVEGKFDRGDKISIFNLSGKEIAKGITAYNSSDLDIIKGKKSDQFEKILGYDGREAAIHTDNLVLV